MLPKNHFLKISFLEDCLENTKIFAKTWAKTKILGKTKTFREKHP
jgi:hypothetical protein